MKWPDVGCFRKGVYNCMEKMCHMDLISALVSFLFCRVFDMLGFVDTLQMKLIKCIDCYQLRF